MASDVFEVRIHGRGGQGVVTAAELLSVAAFKDGRHAQAFPSFGSERMGAPVVAFCRLADGPIRLHEPVAEPDALIIVDPTLLHQVAVFEGCGPEAQILINSSHDLATLGLTERAAAPAFAACVRTVPATELARRALGRPLPNAAILGAFAAQTGVVSLRSVEGAILERFSGEIGAGNVAAARQAYRALRPERSLSAHA